MNCSNCGSDPCLNKFSCVRDQLVFSVSAEDMTVSHPSVHSLFDGEPGSCIAAPPAELVAMKLYDIRTLWFDDRPKHVLVLAFDEDQARQLAVEIFKEERKPYYHDEAYWNILDIEVVFDSVSKPIAKHREY